MHHTYIVQKSIYLNRCVGVDSLVACSQMAEAKKFSFHRLTTVNLRKCLVNSKQIDRAHTHTLTHTHRQPVERTANIVVSVNR